MAVSTLSKSRARSAVPHAVPAAKPGFEASRKAAYPRGHLRAIERRTVDKALQILGSYMREVGDLYSSPSVVKHFAMLQLGSLPYEVFGVSCLDAQNRLIEYQAMFRGTLTQTAVHPREIVIFALSAGAASVVLMHNHPSGSVNPSHADFEITEKLKQAHHLVEVRVFDHIIVSGNVALSMAERGLL